MNQYWTFKPTFDSYLNKNVVTVKFKNKEFKIQFANTVPKFDVKKSNAIFDTMTIDDDMIFNKSIKKSDSHDIITMNKLCLFQNCRVVDLQNFVNVILETNCIYRLKEESNTDILSRLFVGPDEICLYNDKDYVNNYGVDIEDSKNWYVKMCQLIHTYNLKKEYNVYGGYYSIEYMFTPKYKSSTNIIKIFNTINTNSKFRKVIVHDELLDNYNNVSKIQYLKTIDECDDLFIKHIPAKYNILTLYYNKNITGDIILELIDIYKTGVFKLNFLIQTNLSRETIIETINDYINTKCEELFKLMLIGSCTFSEKVTELNYSDYEFKINRYYIAITIPSVSYDKIEAVKQLLEIKHLASRYSTETTLRINNYCFITQGILYELNCEIDNKKVLSNTILEQQVLPDSCFDFQNIDGEDSLNIQFNRIYSIPEFEFFVNFVLPLVDVSITDLNKILISEADKILERCKRVPIKVNLKQLTAADKNLFAPRLIKTTPRPYSALCQVKEQRPVLISKTEYETIFTKYPESLYNLENQSSHKERLYMVCPYNKYRFANFHQLENQICIPRCTTKPSNPNQFKQCSDELGNVNQSNSNLTYMSNQIINYIDRLPIGRRCKVPFELIHIFHECYLEQIDLKTFNSAKDYMFNNYKLNVIQLYRRGRHAEYAIEYDNTIDLPVCLCLLTAFSKNNKFMLLCKNAKPVVLNDEYKPFLIHIQELIKRNQGLVDYNKFFLKLLFNDDTIHESFIDECIKRNCKFVVQQNDLIAIIYNDIVYQVTNLPNSQISKIGNKIAVNMTYRQINNGVYKLLTFKQFVSKFENIVISKVYIDIEQTIKNGDETVVAINYNNDIFTIEPILFKNIFKHLDNDVEKIYIDYSNYIQFLINDSKKYQYMLNDYISLNTKYEYLIKEYLNYYRYLYKLDNSNKITRLNEIEQPEEIENHERDLKQFMNMLTKLDVYSTEDNIRYLNGYSINIFQTKISKKTFDEFIKNYLISFKKYDLSSISYELLTFDLDLKKKNNEHIYDKAFI